MMMMTTMVYVFVFSWASGSNPWGPERDDQFMRPTHYDGMLEVVGVTGVVHMGQIQSGLRSAMRIAQGGHVSRHSQFYTVAADVFQYNAADLKKILV